MKYEEGEDNVNPWDVGKLEEFMYFICPECDKRDQSREHFLQHAMNEHPKAKDYLQKFKEIKEEPLEEQENIECEPDHPDDTPNLYFLGSDGDGKIFTYFLKFSD